MFNNRMLAVAAVLVMAVPALGAATPIVVPPVPEQLVEGHTVFTVIEIVAENRTNTLEVRFAAAVAVLVREYRVEQVRADQRFPGVLWFNDQYLTNPYNQVDNNNDEIFRYPCGGAVMAVNAGDPDPRMTLAKLTVRGATLEGDVPDGVDDVTGDVNQPVPPVGTVEYGDDTETYGYPPWDKPYPGTYTYGGDYQWIGADVGPSTVNATNPSLNVPYNVWSDTVLGSALGGIDYRESYLITDPNDHSWIIDLYDFYTRNGRTGNLGSPGAPAAYTATTTFPVWVVNMLGSPVFIPDPTPLGVADNCSPFKDLIDSVGGPVNDATCGFGVPNFVSDGEGADDEINVPRVSGPPYTDDPCMGYQEPSRNGYCYGGQNTTLTAGQCPHGRPGNTGYGTRSGTPNAPLRQYNALLYFHLEDLNIAGTPRDHSNVTDPLGDTNGCSQEQYPWGPNPPQAAYDWPCPGGDDNREGNSHPFHPIQPAHEEAEPCPAAFRSGGAGANPSNHGGSTYVTPTTPTRRDGGQDWYQVYAPCDYLHATRNIDIYFSGGGRPFAPVVREFNVLDLEGSSAPFQDFHASYP